MAKYTFVKDLTGHEKVAGDFKINIPSKRESWRPPEGYFLEFHKYHRSAKRKRYYSDGGSQNSRRNDADPAPKIGTVEKGARLIGKARSQWHGQWRNGQYDVYTTMLWAVDEDA
jgi:hypothetical protein